MILTNKQEEGLRIAVQRYREGQPYTCISGYAGTGKSTLVKYIIAALNVNPGIDVAYVAFTGKAAEVLRHKGCANATTAHKLLYKAKPMPDGKFRFIPRDILENPYKVIVVDEVSMLPLDLWNLLLSHKVYIIACGDPFQLPPISKDTDNRILEHPHVFLDEIMRQAKESEIIRITMDIREGKALECFSGNEVQVINKNDIVSGMYSWADQVITATNKMRNDVNALMRQLYERDPEPQVNDKVICLRNCWEQLDDLGETALVNGTIGTITEIEKQYARYPIYGIPSVPILKLTIDTEYETFHNIIADYTSVKEGNKFLTPEQEYKIFINKRCPPAPIEFNYGYAITCHRAQGSQWSNVMVIEERFPFDKIEHARWLYTACTRASKKLILVR